VTLEPAEPRPPLERPPEPADEHVPTLAAAASDVPATDAPPARSDAEDGPDPGGGTPRQGAADASGAVQVTAAGGDGSAGTWTGGDGSAGGGDPGGEAPTPVPADAARAESFSEAWDAVSSATAATASGLSVDVRDALGDWQLHLHNRHGVVDVRVDAPPDVRAILADAEGEVRQAFAAHGQSLGSMDLGGGARDPRADRLERVGTSVTRRGSALRWPAVAVARHGSGRLDRWA
jgi:hypothetical protein